MNGKFWIFICWAACCLSACSQSPIEQDDGPYDEYLHLTFTKGETRADMNDSGAGTFSEGDKVGLFIDNGADVQYRELVFESGEWQPRLRRSEFGSGVLTLSAHYPVVRSAADPAAAPVTVDADQRNDAGTASDLLFAQARLEVGCYSLGLSFRHLMHRLQLRIGDAPDDLEVQVRSLTSGTVNLQTGEVTPDVDSFGWIVPNKVSDGHYQAVILPQSALPFRSGDGLLKIASAGRESSYMAPEQLEDKPFTQFEAGKQTTIRLTLKSETRPDLANKTLWVYGVHAPDFPGKENIPTYPPYQETFPMGAWFRYNFVFDEVQWLTWDEGCGWYDCNKSKLYDENDSALCWAASASNLLIWWLVQNKPYIEAYDREYGSSVVSQTNPNRTFERPSSEFRPLYFQGQVNRAPVFEFFKQSFYDKSNWNSAAVNWFITGNTTNLVSPSISGFPGFFHEIFEESDIIAVDSNRSPTEEEFNEFIIDALLNRKAIGFVVYDIAGTGTGNHALVIWGAEFDETGRVSHVYYCENNRSDGDANGAVIVRKKIVYDRDLSYPEAGTRTYTYLQPLDSEDGSPKSKNKVTCLCAVSLRQDIWARHYPDIKPE